MPVLPPNPAESASKRLICNLDSVTMEIPSSEQLKAHRHIARSSDVGDLADLMVHRDDMQILSFPFHSTGDLNVGSINLGGHKSTKSRPVDQGNALVYHKDVEQMTNGDFSGSLNTTKFNKGFQRRMEKDCKNELKDQEQAYFAAAALKKEQMREVRREEVARKKNERGFDILTGKLFEGHTAPKEKPSMKQLGDGLGPEASHRGFAELRESTVGRFHRPQDSGNNHDARQEVLAREGLNNPRQSALLQAGKSDFPSYGVEDNFSKSQYDANLPQESRHGLVEHRVPGKFTPRTQPGNPSGDAERRKNWAKGFELG